MLVWHDLFSPVYFLQEVTEHIIIVCVQLPSTILQVVILDKDPNCLSCC